MSGAEQGRQPIKCVVWDLDHTLWDGILLEDDAVRLKPGVRALFQTLDNRGILHSIASRNDPAAALHKLGELGLTQYFVYPQIGWNSKAASIQEIARLLNFAPDALAFVDDQPFERDEVASTLPQVLCLDAAVLASIADMPCMKPRFVTDDSRLRRAMYQSDARRNDAETTFVGPTEAFLSALQMVFTISETSREDLQRAEELTVRTHQLNTTGYTYSYDELDAFRSSPEHKLLIAGLSDRYGPYGRIGLCLLHCGAANWTVKLLLMSCRVMSRGVGSVLLNHVMRLAQAAGVTLQAEFVSNERNRMMYITYKFAGFREIRREGAWVLLEHGLEHVPPFPEYLQVVVRERDTGGALIARSPQIK